MWVGLLWVCVGIVCLDLFGGFVDLSVLMLAAGCICLGLVACVLSLYCYYSDYCLFVLMVRCFIGYLFGVVWLY